MLVNTFILRGALVPRQQIRCSMLRHSNPWWETFIILLGEKVIYKKIRFKYSSSIIFIAWLHDAEITGTNTLLQEADRCGVVMPPATTCREESKEKSISADLARRSATGVCGLNLIWAQSTKSVTKDTLVSMIQDILGSWCRHLLPVFTWKVYSKLISTQHCTRTARMNIPRIEAPLVMSFKIPPDISLVISDQLCNRNSCVYHGKAMDSIPSERKKRRGPAIFTSCSKWCTKSSKDQRV